MPEKLEELIDNLGRKYDGDALADGLILVIKRIDKALDDGRLSVFETVAIGAAFVRLFTNARKK